MSESRSGEEERDPAEALIEGMAASENDNDVHGSRPPRPMRECLPAERLAQRLDEEVARAERHGTALSCLLVRIDDAERLVGAHGAQLPDQALSYLGAALERQLRRFDRVGRSAEDELLVVLPGADEQRAEMVARRALGRLHAVKIELDGVRHPLHVSIGIASWQHGCSAAQLLDRVRLAAGAQRVEGPSSAVRVEASRAERS